MVRISYLPVHLGVQLGPVGLVYQGSPLIEKKKDVNNPPRLWCQVELQGHNWIFTPVSVGGDLYPGSVFMLTVGSWHSFMLPAIFYLRMCVGSEYEREDRLMSLTSLPGDPGGPEKPGDPRGPWKEQTPRPPNEFPSNCKTAGHSINELRTIGEG